MDKKQFDPSLIAMLPALFKDWKTLDLGNFTIKEKRKQVGPTGIMKAKRVAKKLRSIKRHRYVERRKSWRRSRKVAA